MKARKIIKNSALTVGAGAIVLGTFATTPVSAARDNSVPETYNEDGANGHESMMGMMGGHTEHGDERFQGMEMMHEELAQKIGITSEELMDNMKDPDFRQQIHEQFSDMFQNNKNVRKNSRDNRRGNRFEHMKEMAQEAGVSMEDFKDARDNPEKRREIRDTMEKYRDEHMSEIAQERGISEQELQRRIDNRKQRNIERSSNRRIKEGRSHEGSMMHGDKNEQMDFFQNIEDRFKDWQEGDGPRPRFQMR